MALLKERTIRRHLPSVLLEHVASALPSLSIEVELHYVLIIGEIPPALTSDTRPASEPALVAPLLSQLRQFISEGVHSNSLLLEPFCFFSVLCLEPILVKLSFKT